MKHDPIIARELAPLARATLENMAFANAIESVERALAAEFRAATGIEQISTAAYAYHAALTSFTRLRRELETLSKADA